MTTSLQQQWSWPPVLESNLDVGSRARWGSAGSRGAVTIERGRCCFSGWRAPVSSIRMICLDHTSGQAGRAPPNGRVASATAASRGFERHSKPRSLCCRRDGPAGAARSAPSRLSASRPRRVHFTGGRRRIASRLIVAGLTGNKAAARAGGRSVQTGVHNSGLIYRFIAEHYRSERAAGPGVK